MKKYITIRVIKALLTILAVWTLVFFLARLTGDPVDWMLAETRGAETKERLREQLGLNLPLWQQYKNSFVGLFTGDMGNSYYYARPVVELFAERMGNTVRLGLCVMLFTICLGPLIGVITAVKHNTMFDRVTMGITIMGYTIPNFVFGIVLIFIFSLKLRLLPSSSIGTWKNMIMPIIAMSVAPMSSVARLTRSSLLDVIRQDYLDSARAKGVRESIVILKHGLRNALIPVVTILGAQMSTIIGGSVVVETVFAWPGIGTLLVTAAKQRDFPLVQYGVLMIAISVTFVNLFVDVSYGFLDPRIRDSIK